VGWEELFQIGEQLNLNFHYNLIQKARRDLPRHRHILNAATSCQPSAANKSP
jgi:hypothetical protein